MHYLDVTAPKRPAKYAHSSRLVYRVVNEDTNQMITLPELAEQLKIPYSALAHAVHNNFATVGKHYDTFLKLLSQVRADEKRKVDKRGIAKCPTCHGLGTVYSKHVVEAADGAAPAES